MTEEMKSVIEALKQAIQSLVKISEPKPNFEPGKLIGIGDQRVFFVEEFTNGKMRVSRTHLLDIADSNCYQTARGQ